MQIVVLANAEQQANLAFVDDVIWIKEAAQFHHHPHADALIDLLFTNEHDRVKLLQQFLSKPVIIDSVKDTLKEIDERFIRINGWNTFLSSATIEASAYDDDKKKIVEDIFNACNKTIDWVHDDVGFVTPRVVSMIINEAYLALDEGVSTKEAIDTAMKLGTAYPHGPFEWADKIGLKTIAELLLKLSASQPRYTPAKRLLEEASINS